MSVADYIAQNGKCARGTALLTSFDKLRSQKIISRNLTMQKVDPPRSSRKPTICVLFTVLRGPRVFGYFDHNLRWTSAIRQSCHSHRRPPLICRLNGFITERRYPTTGVYWSVQFNYVLANPVLTWQNRLQRLFETPPFVVPAFLLVDETTPLVGPDNGWLRTTSVVEPTYLSILPSSGKPCILL